MQAGSAVELSPGVLYSVTVAVSNPGAVDVVLRDDPCNTASMPAFLTVMADFTAPQAELTLLQEPTLANSSLVVFANFTKAVQPLHTDNVTVTGATVRHVMQTSNRTAWITVEGTPGADVTVQLASFG